MAPDPTFAFVGGPCCPTLDLVIAFRIIFTLCDETFYASFLVGLQRFTNFSIRFDFDSHHSIRLFSIRFTALLYLCNNIIIQQFIPLITTQSLYVIQRTYCNEMSVTEYKNIDQYYSVNTKFFDCLSILPEIKYYITE